jgi:hypothetical protein
VVRPRRVLFNHEDPSTDTADRELLMALDCDLVDRDLEDPCQRRVAMQEGHELLNRPLGTLGVNQDGAVIPVAHPAHHTELTRLSDRRVAKSDALHLTAHDGTDRRGRNPVPPISHSTSELDSSPR